MSTHLSDDTMMRNGCLTLCQFGIPNDVVSVRLIALLLLRAYEINLTWFPRFLVVRVRTAGQDSVARCGRVRAGGFCAADSHLPAEFAGLSSGRTTEIVSGRSGSDHGKCVVVDALLRLTAIDNVFILHTQTMLNLINDRLQRKVFDDVMEVAWSTMWNVTDETPQNCERFLDGYGMEYFLGCLEVSFAFCVFTIGTPLKFRRSCTEFSGQGRTRAQHDGTAGQCGRSESAPASSDVAEIHPGVFRSARVQHRRHRGMRLCNLCPLRTDDSLISAVFLCVQVSYNAAGVLAHIASDGPEAWTIETPTRQYVLCQMVHAIDRWDLNAERNINYRSFEPILGLLRCYDTPECQHWAVWALANLTKVSEIDCVCEQRKQGVEFHVKRHVRVGVSAQILAPRGRGARHGTVEGSAQPSGSVRGHQKPGPNGGGQLLFELSTSRAHGRIANCVYLIWFVQLR